MADTSVPSLPGPSPGPASHWFSSLEDALPHQAFTAWRHFLPCRLNGLGGGSLPALDFPGCTPTPQASPPHLGASTP